MKDYFIYQNIVLLCCFSYVFVSMLSRSLETSTKEKRTFKKDVAFMFSLLLFCCSVYYFFINLN